MFPDNFSLQLDHLYFLLKKLIRVGKQQKPAIVIVGGNHGDYFFSQKDKLQQSGISIDMYSTERTIAPRRNSDDRSFKTVFQENARIDQDVLLERELLIGLLGLLHNKLAHKKRLYHLGDTAFFIDYNRI